MTNEGRIAVVTGAAKGIGRAIALALGQRGWDVALLDTLEETGHTTRNEVAALGVRAFFLPTDVADERQVRAAAKAIEAEGPVGVLVNNAGIFPRAAALDMPVELWQRVLTVNLGGAFLCSRTFAHGMLAQGGGDIVMIASGRGLQGARMGSHYAASKAGIINLARSLAQEWAPTIRVNTVIPGITDTDQPREAMQSEDELYGRGSKLPLGRIGQPEDIAVGVCLLLSPEAGYITGQSLCVNGGGIMQ